MNRYMVAQVGDGWVVLDVSHPPAHAFATLPTRFDADALARFLNSHAEAWVAERLLANPEPLLEDVVGF